MKYFKYKAFVHNKIETIGNPASIFLLDEKDLNLSNEEKAQLAIQEKSPISCFVNLFQDTAKIEFFAPNGQPEDICFHGSIATAKMLYESYNKEITLEVKNYEKIETIFYNNDLYGIKFKNIIDVERLEDVAFKKNICDILPPVTEKDILDVYRNQKLNDIIVEFNDAKILENLSFEKEKIKKFINFIKKRAIILFAKCGKNNVKSRILYTNLEDLEDICCGSANISISKILLEKYGIKDYINIQPFNFQHDGKIGGYQDILFDASTEELTIKGHVSNFNFPKDYFNVKQEIDEKEKKNYQDFTKEERAIY